MTAYHKMERGQITDGAADLAVRLRVLIRQRMRDFLQAGKLIAQGIHLGTAGDDTDAALHLPAVVDIDDGKRHRSVLNPSKVNQFTRTRRSPSAAAI